MTKKPFFSIFIPTYNRSKDLRFAIFCLLRQSFSDFEIIIIDNCSTDNTRSVVSEIKDRRIRYYRNHKNLGFYSSAKKGIKYSYGKYIFLHGDDDFIFSRTALEQIYKKIKEKNPGYIRVGYLSRTPDRRKLFRFGLAIFFNKDAALNKDEKNLTIWNFVNKTDPYFISGIIFKNLFPQNIKIVETEPIPWIKLLLYASKKLGAQYISEPLVIASWSVWSPQKGYHPVYSLRKGKLASEGLCHIMKQFLDKKDYAMFLDTIMMGVYVNLFPVIKIKMGNSGLKKLAVRIREVDPFISKYKMFWAYLYISLVIPTSILQLLRRVYFQKLIRERKNDNKQILSQLKTLEQEFHEPSGD